MNKPEIYGTSGLQPFQLEDVLTQPSCINWVFRTASRYAFKPT